MMGSLFAVVASGPIGRSDDPVTGDTGTIEQSGRVSRVTLYRDQALVTRTLQIPAGEGGLVIRITGLPEQVVPGSVYAEGQDGLDVRAVRVQPQVISEEPLEAVRSLTAKIDQLNLERREAQSALEVLDQQQRYLDQMEAFGQQAGRGDLDHGVLQPEALQQLTEFVFAKRKAMAEQRLAASRAVEDFNRQIELTERERQLLSAGSTKTVYEATLFCDRAQAAPASELQLNYLVASCGWSPLFTLHGNSESGEFDLRYSALVQQLSGENWDQVKLTLSTASPSVSASAPLLAPFRVSAQSIQQVAVAQPQAIGNFDEANSYRSKIGALKMQQQLAEVQNRATVDRGENFRSLWRMNTFGCDLQVLELKTDAQVARMVPTENSDQSAGLTYELAGAVSLASRADQQVVRITDANLPGRLEYVAIPLLSSYVYREAELTNTSTYGLLAGPMSVYLDDRFVGRTEIPTTAQGQRLTVGFGADPQLRTTRALTDKQDRVQGGNRQLTMTYRLVVSNYNDRPVRVRLMDRLPSPEQPQAVAVKLIDPKIALSDNAAYLQLERPRGILRWDLEVPPADQGGQSHHLDYSYSLEFDRQLDLTGSDAQAMEQEFYEANSVQFPTP
jgi:hypothetical protein